jgi:hypothetical protein
MMRRESNRSLQADKGQQDSFSTKPQNFCVQRNLTGHRINAQQSHTNASKVTQDIATLIFIIANVMVCFVRVGSLALLLLFQTVVGASFDPIRFLERQAPLTNSPVRLAGEISTLQNDELVLGVFVNGEARAYPLNIITRPPREIINDTLGGTLIAVTWCSRCHHGVVFARSIKDRTLTFGIEGSLWLNNMVMYDLETGSQWVQFTGEGKSGPFQGLELRRIPSVITDWQSWKELHPTSTVVTLDKITSRYTTKLQQQRGKYLLGYNINNQSRGYPFDVLKERRLVNDKIGDEPVLVTFDPESTTAAMFSRRLGEQTLTFTETPDHLLKDDSGSIWEPLGGKCISGAFKGKALKALPAQVALQATWLRFHAGSQIQGFQ